MTVVNPTSKEALIASVNEPRAAQSGAEQLQDRFLKLLVTQMRNQDPLNPMENAEVTTQLAQISTVSGIDKLNRAMESMAQGFLSAQLVQAGSLIGRGVLAPGSTLVLEGGRATGGVVLDGAADRVTVDILTPAGTRVATLNLGSSQAGTLTFDWNGKADDGSSAPDGLYVFDVAAVKGAEKAGVERLGFGRVQSVTLGENELQLNTYGLGPLAMSRVAQIL
jgi:flagellar basal-body rod modification protein FlgD